MFAALAALFLALEVPLLRERVNDFARVLTPADAAAIEAMLVDLERTDSTQVVLLVVRTVGEVPIEEFALEVARKNRIGQAGRNNGALVLVAVDDRRVRIEVGEGLEGRLPDSVCALIIKNEMVPRFREADISGGARAGIEAIVKAVRGEYKGEYKGSGRTRGSADRAEDPRLVSLVLVVLIAAGILRVKRRRALAFALVPLWSALGWLVGLPLSIAFGWVLVLTLVGLFAQGGGGRTIFLGGGSFGRSGSSSRGFSGGGGRFSGGGASGSW